MAYHPDYIQLTELDIHRLTALTAERLQSSDPQAYWQGLLELLYTGVEDFEQIRIEKVWLRMKKTHL